MCRDPSVPKCGPGGVSRVQDRRLRSGQHVVFGTTMSHGFGFYLGRPTRLLALIGEMEAAADVPDCDRDAGRGGLRRSPWERSRLVSSFCQHSDA